ncbi:MAG TPA: NFACT RNA binding domain-containing protein, partial [Chloroflexia bacterium]|nr:NFACT RNA binding domain-containing protein [Chloroflexia bacterium]
MPFDALTLAAVRQEIESKYLGGRVQGLLMPGPFTLSLELYRSGSGRSHLVMSAHPQHARLHLAAKSPTRDPEQHPPLLLLLRKYVRGGTLVDISQPRYERVIALSIAKRIHADKHQEYHSGYDFRQGDGPTEEQEEEDEDPSAPVKVVDLIVEVMGKVSNIVLVDDDGTVLDSMKRVPSSINRYRVTLPRHAYVAPPPQDKRDPQRTSIHALSAMLDTVAEDDPKAPAWKGLVAGYLAVSPTLAREVAYRALGEVLVPAAEVAGKPERLASLLRELQELLLLEERGSWQPSIAWKGTARESQPQDFAPYLLTHLEAQDAEVEQCDTVSEAADRYFASVGNITGHSALKGQAQVELDELRGRDERRLNSLREELQRSQALEALRRKGEMLLAYMHSIQPGQRQLAIPEEDLTIELDPGMTPVEQAQAIFREYRKARSAREELPALMSQAQTQMAYLDELQTSLDLATTHDEIRAVQAELHAVRSPGGPAPEAAHQTKGGKARKQQIKLPQPLRTRTRYGASVLIGRTAGQNDVATFRLADPDDLWLHARGVPGSHVILRTGQGYTEADLREAASFAAAYSKARTEAQVDVIYTE